MGLEANTELQTILNSLSTSMGSIGTTGSTKGGTKTLGYNDVAWFANAVNGETSTEENVQQGVNFATKILEMVSSFVSNQETKSAEKSVKSAEKKLTNIENGQKDLETTLNQQIESINAQIVDKTNILNNALAELAQNGKDVNEQQEKANEVQEQIQKKQEELNGATTPEDKKAILGDLQGLLGELAGLITEIEPLKTAGENNNEIVEQAQGEITVLSDDVQVLQTNSQAQIVDLTQQGTQVAAETTVNTTRAGVDKGISEAAKAAAKTANTAGAVTFGASNVAGAKLEMMGQDYGNASTKLFTSAATITPKLTTSLGNVFNNLNSLTTFTNSIGGEFSNMNSIVGEFQGNYSPFISAVGSALEVQEPITEFTDVVEEELAAVESTEKQENVETTESQSASFDTEKLKLNQFGV